ncbi:hypothetical protein [Variovorax sp. HJSM1_2]
MRKILFSFMFFFGGLASEISQPTGRPCPLPSTHAARLAQRPGVRP